MIQNLFILSSTGEVIIEKHWRDAVSRSVCDLFWERVVAAPSPSEVVPVLHTPQATLIHVHRYNLFFLSTVAADVSPLLVMEAQQRIVAILNEYFAATKINELVLKDNFSTVYQLLDEMVDGGFPSTTESNALKEMITPPNLATRLLRKLGDADAELGVRHAMPGGAMSKIPWRKLDVRYVANEIYFDLIEHLDCIIGTNGQIVKCDVYGEVMCTSKLSGMPDLTLTFTNANVLQDETLHRCVRIDKYRREKIVSFVPPDGTFRLLTYRTRGINQLPVYVNPRIDYRKGSGSVQVTVGMKHFTGDKMAEDVALTIPLPRELVSSAITANHGTVRVDDKTKMLTWTIGKIPKIKTPELKGTVTFPPDMLPDDRPTIGVQFNVKMLSTTGLKVDGLGVKGVKYKPFKGVRSITKAGRYEIRC